MELPLIQLHEAFISPLERLPTSGNQMEAVCLYWIQVQVKRRIKVTSFTRSGWYDDLKEQPMSVAGYP